MNDATRLHVYLEMSKEAARDVLWAPYNYDPRRKPTDEQMLQEWSMRFAKTCAKIGAQPC
jgi:hypothetical protein